MRKPPHNLTSQTGGLNSQTVISKHCPYPFYICEFHMLNIFHRQAGGGCDVYREPTHARRSDHGAGARHDLCSRGRIEPSPVH